MRTITLRILSIVLIGTFFLESLAGCGVSAGPDPRHSQDDAMLLMIASTVRIMEGEGVSAGVLRSGMAPVVVEHSAQAGQTANEIGIMVGIYEDLYTRYSENLAAVDPRLAEKFADQLGQEYQAKVEPLLAKKAKLDASRRRKRWGLFRAIGRGLSKFAQFIGRTTITLVQVGSEMLLQEAVNMVKGRIQEIFEGRINTLLARLASKFGPLGPFVQDKLKAALDRWWIRTRDRITGRLARQATQTAKAGLAQVQPPQSAEVEADDVQIDESEFGADECDPQGLWFEDYWDQIAVPALKQDHKYCVDWTPYSGCLYEKARQGMCAEDAHAACESVYDAIPPAQGASAVTIVDDAVYFRDNDNHFDITFPLNGGPVSGYASWDFTDDFFGERSCYVSQTFTFSGTYDPATCILSGTGIHTLQKQERYTGDCLGVSDPYEKSIPWRIDLNKGTLNTCAKLPITPLCLLYEISSYTK